MTALRKHFINEKEILKIKTGKTPIQVLKDEHFGFIPAENNPHTENNFTTWSTVAKWAGRKGAAGAAATLGLYDPEIVKMFGGYRIEDTDSKPYVLKQAFAKPV